MEYKLGKLPPKIDRRTIKLSKILKALPPPPEAHNIDNALNGIEDDFMFNNSQYGDCVIAARAHQTLRFEKFEQGKQIVITDQEVIHEYKEQTGGPDTGLVLLYSLKDWKNDGWIVGGKRYKIYAFASVDWKDHDEVKNCIHLLGGVNFGMRVYSKDLEQFKNDEVWSLTGDSGSLKGGHGVYVYSYDTEGLVCMTWGKRQRMTWDFWDARVDEAYGIVDNVDPWIEDSELDVERLNGYLQEITEGRGEGNIGCLTQIFFPAWYIVKLLRECRKMKRI